ncbi:MAG: hypothetical protein ABEK02_09705 [Haloquadratum sp.]
MGAIPSGIETDAQPPMRVPLRHFVVSLGFLIAGAAVGALVPLEVVPGLGTLAHVHLLLVGWVCLTIVGAMTQFVPVWSGTTLHSSRLSVVQLWAVAAGLVGFVVCLLGGVVSWLPLFGGLLLVGFWIFVYNVGRTLLGVRPWDVTERHFALALGFFLLATALGLTLAVGYTRPLFVGEMAGLGLARARVRAAHATLAVFGIVLTTVFGALYQLGPMFTQSDLHGLDCPLRRVEEVGYPLGVLALAAGRLVGSPLAARVGGLLVVAGVAAMGVILARRLVDRTVEWSPMLRRYGVAAVAMCLWAVGTAPGWLAAPLAPDALFGPPALSHLLLFGVVGFVVFGTLYHVVPFIVWVHRYSDRLGFETVPMIDDLSDDRLARVDFGLLVLGLVVVVAVEAGTASSLLAGATARVALAVGGFASLVGCLAFAGNLLAVVRNHGGDSLAAVVISERLSDRSREA